MKKYLSKLAHKLISFKNIVVGAAIVSLYYGGIKLENSNYKIYAICLSILIVVFYCSKIAYKILDSIKEMKGLIK